MLVGDVQVLVEHGDLGSLREEGLSLRRDRLEPWDKFSAIELGDLREEESHCLLVILEVAHRVRPVLGPLED